MKWCFELQMEAKYLSVAVPSVLLVVELVCVGTILITCM